MTKIHTKTTDQQGSGSTLAWIAWLMAAIFYAYQFFHRVAPSVMASDLMLTFSINAESLGTLAAFYFYAYAAAQIPAGVLLDCFGSRKSLTIASAFVAVGSLLFAFTTDFQIAKFARFLTGLGSTVAFTGCLIIAAKSLPERYFNTVVGLTSTIGIMGALSGETPLTKMIQCSSWRSCMSMAGFFGLVITVSLYLAIRDSKALKVKKKEHFKKAFSGIRPLFTNPQAWLLALIAGTRVIPVISFGELWAIPYLQHGHQYTINEASMILSCLFIGIGIGGPLFGGISNLFGIRQSIITGAWLSLISYLALFWHGEHHPVVLSVIFLCIGLASSSMLQCFGLICKIAPDHSRGAAIGFMNTAVMIPGALFQPLIGKLLDISWDGAQHEGLAAYTLQDFHFALSIVIPFIIISLASSYLVGLKKVSLAQK